MNRAARRRGDPRKQRQQLTWLLVGAVAILIVAGGVVFALVTRGEGDSPTPAGDGTPGIRTPSTGGTRGGPAPVLGGPAVKYAASQQEIGGGIQAVPNESANITPETYADPSIGPFKDINIGRDTVRQWGYKEGYLGVFQPDGLASGMLLGRFYVRLETHLFESTAGATNAFKWYSDLYNSASGVEKTDSNPLANESGSWRSVLGKIETSDLDRVYHRFVFRRGNMVSIVQTVGADTFMTIDPARDIAVIVDDRALGNRAAPTPTPSGGTLPPTPVR